LSSSKSNKKKDSAKKEVDEKIEYNFQGNISSDDKEWLDRRFSSTQFALDYMIDRLKRAK